MKKYIFLLIPFVFACVSESEFIHDPADRSGQKITGQYIVIMEESYMRPIILEDKRGFSAEEVLAKNIKTRDSNENEIRSFIGTLKQDFLLDFVDTKHEESIYTDAVVGFELNLKGDLDKSQLDELRNHPKIASVIQNYIMIILSKPLMQSKPIMQSRPLMQSNPLMQNDIEMFDLYNFTIETGLSCAVEAAGGSKLASPDKSNRVWIIDTGIDVCHPYLNINDSLAKSWIDYEGKFGDSLSINSFEDFNGHGTHVAGIIGAISNPLSDDNVGWSPKGVSAGAEIIPLKVLDSRGEGTWKGLLDALEYIGSDNYRDNDVVNISMGAMNKDSCEDQSSGVRLAIERLASKKVYIVMSAGNDNKKVSKYFPACINGENIYTVGAMDCNVDKCSGYSNYGNNQVDWMAVGTNVLSLWPRPKNCENCDVDSAGQCINELVYVAMSGTSMSAAVVSGVIHANEGPPVAVDEVPCHGKKYNVAHLEPIE